MSLYQIDYYITTYYMKPLLIWLAVFILWKLTDRQLQLKYVGRWQWVHRGFVCFIFCSTVAYLSVFVLLTLVRDVYPEAHYELSLFWEYRLAFGLKSEFPWLVIKDAGWARQIRDNIMLFVPMGLLFQTIVEGISLKRGDGRVSFGPALVVGFAVSFVVEYIQLKFHLGLFEFDDMINNVTGMMIGYGISRIR